METNIERVTSYIQGEQIGVLNQDVIQALKEAVLDIIGSTVAGYQAPVTQMVESYACREWGKGKSTVMGSGKKLTATGATLVNATMANALDLDDGHRLVKGHPGAVIFPAVLAVAEQQQASGREFLSALLVGYEIGIRAGILAHQLRPEYHCTGSWGAIGAAAATSKLLGLSTKQIEHALGVAEYHSTYSPMMRCIDYPSMVKDGIGWGSMTGVSSAYLAQEGFTGIPSLFSFQAAEGLVNELNEKYRIKELYYKPHACCRWAQPAVEGIKQIIEQHSITGDQVEKIMIHTFEESLRLGKRPPQNTEEAQYNLGFPVAAYLLYKEVGPKQILHGLDDQPTLQLLDRIEIHTDEEINKQFPEKALSRVEVYTTDGNRFESPVLQAKGDYDFPLSTEEKLIKYEWLSTPVLGREKSKTIKQMVDHLEKVEDLRELTSLLTFD